MAMRIQIPESSDWQRRFESLMKRFESKFSKVIEIDQFESQIKRFESLVKKEEMLRATDSNHPFNDSNPSWRTWIEIEARIQIPYTTIRIPEFGVMKNKARRFESSSYGFESLSKSKGWRSVKAIRIFELQIWIPLSAKFKSHSGDLNPLHSDRIPLGAKFKSRSGDSNSLNNDSNPWLCKNIKCVTCNSIYPIFKSNLSHNG